MSPDEHKTLGRTIVNAINSGDLASVDTLFTSDFVDRNPLPGSSADLQGLKQSLAKVRTAFPDFRYTIEDEIAVGDRLVHRLAAKGTQKGEFMGLSATGKHASWSEIHIARIVNGKVAEHWATADQRSMMEQLGMSQPVK